MIIVMGKITWESNEMMVKSIFVGCIIIIIIGIILIVIVVDNVGDDLRRLWDWMNGWFMLDSVFSYPQYTVMILIQIIEMTPFLIR